MHRKLTGRRPRSNVPLIWLHCPNYFLSQVTQLIKWSTLSTLAQKSIPLVAGSDWPKPVLISLIEEYGAPESPSLLKFNYTTYTFNRSSSTVLKLGPWHELWKTGLLPLTTFASDVFYGFRTQTMLPMLLYDSELALHRSCCRSSKQDGSVSSGTWQGWATHTTCSELYIHQSTGWPRTGGAAQDVHVTPGYGPFSRSTTDWTQHAQDQGRWKHLVETATLQFGACMWRWWWMHCNIVISYKQGVFKWRLKSMKSITNSQKVVPVNSSRHCWM